MTLDTIFNITVQESRKTIWISTRKRSQSETFHMYLFFVVGLPFFCLSSSAHGINLVLDVFRLFSLIEFFNFVYIFNQTDWSHLMVTFFSQMLLQVLLSVLKVTSVWIFEKKHLLGRSKRAGTDNRDNHYSIPADINVHV